MKKMNYVIADAFTNTPLEGNPVAVFLNPFGISARDMQLIAKEMNLSETTFVFPPKMDGDFYVRIFTPVNELPFAGHPTLGTAIVLAEKTTQNHIILETAMGAIPFYLDRTSDGKILYAQMEQPIPTWETYECSDIVLQGLGLESSILPIEIYRNGPRHVFVGLPSVSALSSIHPDLKILAQLQDVAINCFAKDNESWRIRMFSPAYGVAEDAATGSAAGPLALHLARHDFIDFGQWLDVHQGVEMGKHSIMRAQVIGTEQKIISINVAGSAVIIARGEFGGWTN
jgi:trans-2,3-dihydro-3-hydroxyanthranilate isomerase